MSRELIEKLLEYIDEGLRLSRTQSAHQISVRNSKFPFKIVKSPEGRSDEWYERFCREESLDKLRESILKLAER